MKPSNLSLTVLLCLSVGMALSQNAYQAETFSLSSTLPSSQSHEYTAGNYIELNSGFLSEPLGDNSTMLQIDPYYNPENTYGLLYNTPTDQTIEGRLGFYPMDFHVNECGAATISLPLEFPEGINGMTPHLSLEYNSQAGNGIMGLGWSLGGMSKISRVPYTYNYNDESHSVQFSSEDQLSLDGVILKTGSFNGITCYYPEIYDYSTVLPITGGFKVLKSNGLVYTYTAKYYLQQSIDQPIEWHLSKIEDTDGNRIEYEYGNNRDEGAFWPERIRYTGREGLLPAYEIRFVYDTLDERPDCPKKWFSQPGNNTCNPGFSRVTRKLTEIDCFYDGDRIIRYKFSYITLDWLVRGLAYVEKIFDYSPNERWANNKLIPVKYQWNSTHHCLQYEQAGTPVSISTYYDSNQEWYQYAAFSARFERDKLNQTQKYEQDIVHLLHHDNNYGTPYHLSVFRSSNVIGESGQAYIYNSMAYQYDCSVINNAFGDMRTIHTFMPADTDGDGLNEIVCVYSLGTNLKVSLIKPINSVFQESVYINESLDPFDLGSFQIGDFNGDGLSDLQCLYDNHLLVWMSTSTNPFSVRVSESTPLGGNRRVVVADFSGDLKDQIVVLRQSNDSISTKYYRIEEMNNQSFIIPAPRTVAIDMANYYYGNTRNRLCCGDFNGDGKKDILLICSGAWRFYFSQGNAMFTDAQLMDDNGIVGDDFAASKENDTIAQSFALIADFDHDGCDDVSITLLQEFDRPSQYQYNSDRYKGAFRRDFLIRPTHQEIQVRKIRNTIKWWDNGIQETDACIDSIIPAIWGMLGTKNAFLPIMGNHKGISPTEILYCRVISSADHSHLLAHLHNTGNFLPDSLTRAVTGIINSLGATTEIQYRPVSYQRPPNEVTYGLTEPDRSLTPVLPFNGFLSIVEQYSEEVKDNGGAQSPGKTYRLSRFFYSHPYYHTRGRGLLGFGSLWSRQQGQEPRKDIVTVKTCVLDQTYHLLFPETLTYKHFRESNISYMDPHQQTEYTYTFQNNTNFANALGQIPSGVFSPYLSASVTVRNDGSPLQYEKTEIEKDGYGNVTSLKRRYGNSTSSFPYYEKTETAYEHSVGSNRWILGVPQNETVTYNLTNVAADKVVRHTSWQNDMTHGRHQNMVKESGSGKQLTETYGYDAFGHLTSVTSDIGDGNPRTENFTYSADGRFMSAQTNAAGHTTHYYYDNTTSLLDSVTDPNGLITRYRYDELWDLEQTEYPSGVREDQCMMWVDTCHLQTGTWHPDTPDFGAPVYYTWSKRSGERESVVFYDQHRRKLREVGGTLEGKKIYVDYRYHDVTGLLAEESAPYHPGDGETPQFTQYTYDYLDRKTMEDRPDGAYRSHSYNGLTEIVRGFDGQVKTLTYSRAGLVNKVSDGGNTTSSPVDIDYTWYGDGKVKNVKVGGNNATMTSYTYDVNRNPATVSDPSLGQLTYDYNGFGELVGSATPRDTAQYTYDTLGRMTSRTGYDGTSAWLYDNSFLGALSQTVYTPATGSSVTERFTYDRLGRLTKQTQTIGSQDEWAFEYGYDAMGRRNTVTYPSGKKFKWHYDRNGFMDWVSDHASGTLVWQATATDRWGNTTAFTEGTASVEYAFDPVTGLVTGISARKNGEPLFGQACSWTTVGNLEWRTDTTLNLKEAFEYDRFNRLLTSSTKNLSGTTTYSTQGVQFDNGGNITQKDGVGGFVYGGSNPYAVTALGQDNALAGLLADQTVAYTPFDKVGSVTQDGKTLTVDYGIDRQRVAQTFSDGSTTRTKRYFTPLYERVTENGVTKNIHYLTSASGIFAIFVGTPTGGTMYYTLKDHQGNLAATVHGSTVERLSYDPWGRRRNTTDFGYANVSHTFDRGYTLHEHYDGFDLINMNGRLYDPILGRMLSPDIVVQDEQRSQAYNRYSYCFNNPLRFTDPSGYMVRGSSSLFNGFTLFLYESPHNKGVLFNTDEALGQQLPKIEPFGEEEKKAYIAYRNTVFSYNTKEFKTIQTELIRLENAEEVFRIRMGENTTSKAGGGNFIYNKETGEFDVNIADYGDFSTMGKIAHELKHADQYMDGKIGFDLRGNTVTPFAYDYRDEVEAFERQGLFGNTLTRDEIKGIYYDLWNKGDFKTNKTIYDCDFDNPARPFFLMKKANSDSYNYKKTPVYLYHGWKKDIQ